MLSAPIVITPPTSPVIEPAAMKLFLRIDGTSLDSEIADYVSAAIADIEGTTSTRLAEQLVEIRADRFSDLANLNVGPVNDIVSIAYQGGDGGNHILDAGTYELFGSGLAKGIRPSFGHSWPASRNVSGAIVVQLAVGYGDALPANVALALKLAVRSRFDGMPFDLFAALVNDRIWL